MLVFWVVGLLDGSILGFVFFGVIYEKRRPEVGDYRLVTLTPGNRQGRSFNFRLCLHVSPCTASQSLHPLILARPHLLHPRPPSTCLGPFVRTGPLASISPNARYNLPHLYRNPLIRPPPNQVPVRAYSMASADRCWSPSTQDNPPNNIGIFHQSPPILWSYSIRSTMFMPCLIGSGFMAAR